MPPFLQRHLDRRTFLRGAAAAVALPWLDAMQPALQSLPKPPVRGLFVFAPNGMHMGDWRAKGDGLDAEFGRTLQALQPLRRRVTIWTGFAIDGGRAHGDGPGDHARSAASFLTCAHPRKTGGADLEVGISIDQAIAAAIGSTTTFPSLELGLEKGTSAGICDSGYSCAYSNNVAWRTPNTPVAKETEPRAVFARLFGDPEQLGQAEAQQRQRANDRAVLDAVLADAKSLAKDLGPADRRKLDQYLDAVRDLERRLQRLDAEAASTVAPPPGLASSGNGSGYAERLAAMYEILALAFASDRTRVATLMLGNAGSNRSYKFLDVPEGHHDLSHHGKKPEKLAAIATINRFQLEQFAKFLQGLAARPDQGGDLLGNSLVLFGAGIGDGDRHNHDDLPILLAGEGGGAARGRGHVRLPGETPLANLHLAVARGMGVPLERFGDSSAAAALV
ncbi:MAG: DUF1552 domain-containing protein [Planctomycetes bacterium]|nr:DUF1552 domain-containing protein [Planctomycetota bacterium]